MVVLQTKKGWKTRYFRHIMDSTNLLLTLNSDSSKGIAFAQIGSGNRF